MSDDIKDIKIGGISSSEYVRGIKNGNIDPSFDNAVKAILWAADEIERLRDEYDRLLTSWAECRDLLSKERASKAIDDGYRRAIADAITAIRTGRDDWSSGEDIGKTINWILGVAEGRVSDLLREG